MKAKIPRITREALLHAIEHAYQPIFVVFTEADSAMSEAARCIAQFAADEHRERLAFCEILIDEEPTAALDFNAFGGPCAILFRNGREYRRLTCVTARGVYDLLQEVAA